MSQEPREGPVLFNEVTRSWMEKWSLDCARKHGEALSHFVGV